MRNRISFCLFLISLCKITRLSAFTSSHDVSRLRVSSGLVCSSFKKEVIAITSQPPRLVDRSLTRLLAKEGSENPEKTRGPLELVDDKLFDAKTTVALVGGQSVLIGVAAIAAQFFGTPNLGLGPGIDFSLVSIQQGFLMTLPLVALAFFLDLIEKRFQALQDVTTATQRSVLYLLGGTFKPFIGFVTATGLGLAAGFGEEMLFRGVLQYELGSRAGDIVAVAVSSVIFGALHAVTPLYAVLASLASVYFGYLFLSSGNLAVPIATHTLYDIGALLYAHWTVTNMTEKEKLALTEWEGPTDPIP